MNKEYVVYILQLRHKGNEILPVATIWVDLQGIMLGEISQIEKDKYCVLSFVCGFCKLKQTSENNKETDSQI